MLVSVCVPVYRAHRPPDLRSLWATMPVALGEAAGELVVALNGAPPSVVPVGARVIDLGTNRGVAPGWNAAARAAQGDVLVFANDDVVLGPGSLERLALAARGLPDAGVVGVVPLALPLPSPTLEREHRGPWGAATSCDAVTGFLMAIRSEVFRQVGGFDEAYAPCLWEEADLCLAVRHTLGLHCYVVRDLPVSHTANVSARRSWPWARVRHGGRSESLRAIRRRNVDRLRSKWASPDASRAPRPG